MVRPTRSLESIEIELSRTVVYVAILAFILAAIGYTAILKLYRDQQLVSAQTSLDAALKIYTANLLSQVSIVASTSEFIGYIRSGHASRALLNYEYTAAMSHLPDEVAGWKLYSTTQNSLIDQNGISSNNVILFKLCYLNSTLDQHYGLCIAELTLHLSERVIIRKLREINQNINECRGCEAISAIPRVANPLLAPASSSLSIPITINVEESYWALGASLLLTFAAITWVSLWLRKRANYMIRHEIVRPIMGILDNSANSPDLSMNSSIQQIMDIAYQKKLLLAKTYAEESQKRRLANEIHDLFGALLIQLKWDITQLIPAKPQIAQRALTKLDLLVSITENFIESLRPELLDTLGLHKALIALIDEWSEKNTDCEYSSFISLDSTQIPDAVSNAVFRIAQESLANIFKHAKARHATLRVSSTVHENEYMLNMEIEDDGIGIAYEHDKSKGRGLQSMRECAVSLGGKFKIGAPPGGGTKISVDLPSNKLQ
jgi:signal transduction histidine kinase